MTPKRLFVLNAAIAGFYGVALLVFTDPILDIYGVDANPDGVYMARWFGLGLIATGLTTWLARDAADSPGGRAVGRALAFTYGFGVILALWDPVRTLQRARLGRGGPESASGIELRLARVHPAENLVRLPVLKARILHPRSGATGDRGPTTCKQAS
jgi:hypothetical protein